MSRQYYDDPYGPSRRRVTVPSNQSSNFSSRRNVPPVSREFVGQSTFQPSRERNPVPPPSYHYRGEYSYPNGDPYSQRSSSNRMNISSDDRPQRRYRLETPSTHSPARYAQPYQDQYQEPSRSSDRYQFKNQQPSSNRSPAFQSYRYEEDSPRYERTPDQYDRRHQRSEAYPSQPSSIYSNHRSVDVPSARHQSNPVRSVNRPPPSSQTRPSHRSSHPPVPTSSQPPMLAQVPPPASLLAHLLQGFFGGPNPFLDADDDDDDDNDRSSLAPADRIAFAWIMPRPGILTVPGVLHVQFGDIFGLLADDEPSSVGLSDSDIDRLPTMTYRKSSKSKSTDDKCAVCLSEYKTGETVKRLRCKHIFHPDCIDPWLKTSVQCPICRAAQTN